MKSNNPWITFAEDDLSVLSLIENEDVYRVICFHSQQLSEKILKAALFEQGKKIPKTHDLAYLVKELNITTNFSDDDLEFLSSVYVESRYPPDVGLLPSGEPDERDAKRAFQIANQIYEFITKTF